MSRVIKFRAYIKPIIEDDEIVYSGYMVDVNKIDSRLNRIAYIERNPFLPMYGSYEWIKFEDMELLQYTGMDDDSEVKNEIYDGDILIGSWDSDEYHSKEMCATLEVYWCKVFGKWMVIEYPSYEVSPLYDYYDKLEVIGNKYQNPELLKEDL